MLLISALVFASLTAAAPSQHWTRQHKQFERTSIVDGRWTRLSGAPPSQIINLKIALREGGSVYEHLNEISDPEHARYGKHLSKAEIDAITGAPEETHNLVQTWLLSHGIQSAHIDSNWVNIRVPVSVAEQMLDTEYGIYENKFGKQILRTESYSLPEILHEHIDVVAPTTYFGSDFQAEANTIFKASEGQGYGVPAPPFPVEVTSTALGGLCNTTKVTAACLAQYYGTANYTAKAANKNSFGITGFLGEHLNFADLDRFLTLYAPDKKGYNYTVLLVNNGTNPQSYEEEGEGEAPLDVQEAAAFAAPAKGTFWSTAGVPPIWPDETLSPALNAAMQGNEPYLDWLQYVMAQDTVPFVISTSYGDDEQTVPFTYAQRVCNDLAKLGARGVTLLYSSGDFGVGGNGGSNCTLNDGTNRHMFLPNFPASCPAVTAVGATSGFGVEYPSLYPNYPDVAGSGSSGAGFSRYFSQPAYQKTAVEGYLSKIGNLYDGWYNRGGRAYPDIAFNGRNYTIVYNNKTVRISGTSASAPGLAGFLTLVNDARLAANKTTLGFLNPLLYSGKLKGGFRDTVNGSNPAYSPGCSWTKGFPALEGWDPATGFGSPIFEPWVKAVLALP